MIIQAQYDVIIHECSIPLDIIKIKKEIPEEHKVVLISTAKDEYQKPYTAKRLFEEVGVPKVYVRGHIPDGDHDYTRLITDINWIRENYPEVYLIAFKDEFGARRIKEKVHCVVSRRGLEKNLSLEILRGLLKIAESRQD